MATTLVYSVSPYIPFTKILSANINQDKTDIKNRLNWAGGTSATTGLGDDNIQSIAASGGGLTRATKLKAGTAYATVVNSSTGAMSEVVLGVSKVATTDSNGALQGSTTLAPSLGGTGQNFTLSAGNANYVIAVDPTGVQFSLVPTPIPPQLQGTPIYMFYNFS